MDESYMEKYQRIERHIDERKEQGFWNDDFSTTNKSQTELYIQEHHLNKGEQ